MVGLYLRVSSSLQAEKYSLGTQEKLGIDFCTKSGLPYEIYKDIQSGADFGRQDLQRLLEDVKSGKIDTVWVIEYSRLARDIEDSAAVKKLFIKQKIKLYVNGVYQDLQNIDSSFLYDINAVLSQNERARIIERTQRGATKRKNEGRQVYPDCYGYNRVFDENGKKKWIINEEEAVIVKTMYDKFSKGESLYAILNYLDENEIKTKKGKRFVIGRISNILRRPIYGGLTYNKDGELIKSQLYPAIIDESVWRKLHQERPRLLRDRPYKFARYTCSALIKCKECKRPYVRMENIKASGKHYPMYRAQHLSSCKNRGNFKAILIETVLPRTYFVMYEQIDKIQSLWEAKMKEQVEKDTANQAKVERQKKQLATFEKQRDNLIDAIANGALTKEEAAKKMKDVRTEIDRVQAELNTIPIEKMQKEWDYILAKFSYEQQNAFVDALTAGRVIEARTMLKEVLKEANIYKGILHVEFINDWKAEIDLRNLPPEYGNQIVGKDGLGKEIFLYDAVKDMRRK